MNFTINCVGSMFTLFFTTGEVTNFATATKSDTAIFARYFNAMLNQGVYMAPSQYEAMFVSTAIDDTLLDRILTASARALQSI